MKSIKCSLSCSIWSCKIKNFFICSSYKVNYVHQLIQLCTTFILVNTIRGLKHAGCMWSALSSKLLKLLLKLQFSVVLATFVPRELYSSHNASTCKVDYFNPDVFFLKMYSLYKFMMFLTSYLVSQILKLCCKLSPLFN